jgi:drug/metabolite transporter (DMT)-like permease
MSWTGSSLFILGNGGHLTVARWRVISAFAAVYIIWGTTYLAIRFAVETIPPFLMGGLRFILAGLLLYGWTRFRGVGRPEPSHWKPAIISGVLMVAVAQGTVVWAEQYIASGLAAVLVSMTPIWMMTLNWVRPGGQRPDRVLLAGVFTGFVGVVILLAPWQSGQRDVLLTGAIAVIIGSISWTAGSLYVRTVRPSTSHLQATALQMTCGGALLVGLGSVTGEWSGVSLQAVSARSTASFFYLVVFGSIVALTSYTWLMKTRPPSQVSTYAYVNPVVAVALGWVIAGERLGPRMGVAAAVIVGSVVLVTVGKTTERTGRGLPPAGVDPGIPLLDAPDDV